MSVTGFSTVYLIDDRQPGAATLQDAARNNAEAAMHVHEGVEPVSMADYLASEARLLGVLDRLAATDVAAPQLAVPVANFQEHIDWLREYAGRDWIFWAWLLPMAAAVLLRWLL